MINQKLLFARAYEKEASAEVPQESRPKFHMTHALAGPMIPTVFPFIRVSTTCSIRATPMTPSGTPCTGVMW